MRDVPIRWIAIASVLIAAGAAAGDKQKKPVRVSTFDELRQALARCSPGDEIVLAAGKYHVTRSLYIGQPNVVVRGQTGKPEDVVLHGDGMNTDSRMRTCVSMAADGVELRDLTIRDFWQYGVMLSGRRTRRSLPDRLVLRNLRIQNCGTRYIKGVDSRGYSEAVLIEKVDFRQTVKYKRRPGHPVDSSNYIGGIDCMKAKDWIIRDCRFEGIKGATGGGRGAIFMWIGSVNPTIERNVIVDCGAGICLGNGHNPGDTYHVTGGIVRNNVIYHRGPWRPVELGFTKDVKFVHNTVYAAGQDSRTIDIYDTEKVPTKGLLLQNNLIRGRVSNRAKGKVTIGENLISRDVKAAWFEDPSTGKLALTKAAPAEVGKAKRVEDAPEDIAGRKRPADKPTAFGAYAPYSISRKR